MRGLAASAVLVCLAPCCRAQDSIPKALVGNVGRDQKVIWTQPMRITRAQAGRVVIFTVMTAALIATDRYSAGSLPTGQAGYFSRFTNIGVGAFGASLGGLFIAGKATGNDRAVETGLLGAEALADSFLVSSALKLATQRQRPADGNGKGHFFTGGTSFPSGHSFMAWSMAEVIAHEYHEKPLVRIGAYSLAALVSLSRFPARKHFLSDVFAGSAGGLLIGHYVWRQHHDGGRKWSAMPIASTRIDPRTRTYGLALTWHWR